MLFLAILDFISSLLLFHVKDILRAVRIFSLLQDENVSRIVPLPWSYLCCCISLTNIKAVVQLA